MGRSSYDSPGELRLALEKTHQLNIEQVRSDLQGSSAGFGNNVIRKNTWQYYHRLATSKYLIDNQSLPLVLQKAFRPVIRADLAWHTVKEDGPGPIFKPSGPEDRDC